MFSIRATGDTDWTPTLRATDAIREYQGALEVQELVTQPSNFPRFPTVPPPEPALDRIAYAVTSLSTPSWGHLLVEDEPSDFDIDIRVDDGNGAPFYLLGWKIVRARPLGDVWVITVSDTLWYQRQVAHAGGTDSRGSWDNFFDDLLAPLGLTQPGLPGGLPAGFALDHFLPTALVGKSLCAVIDYLCAILGLRGVLNDGVVTFTRSGYVPPDITDQCEGGDADVSTVGGDSTLVYFDKYGAITSVSNPGQTRTYWTPDGFSGTWTRAELEAWRAQTIFQGALAGGVPDPESPVWSWVVWDSNVPRPRSKFVATPIDDSLLPPWTDFKQASGSAGGGAMVLGNTTSPAGLNKADRSATQMRAVNYTGLEIDAVDATDPVTTIRAIRARYPLGTGSQWGVVSDHLIQEFAGEKRLVHTGVTNEDESPIPQPTGKLGWSVTGDSTTPTDAEVVASGQTFGRLSSDELVLAQRQSASGYETDALAKVSFINPGNNVTSTVRLSTTDPVPTVLAASTTDAEARTGFRRATVDARIYGNGSISPWNATLVSECSNGQYEAGVDPDWVIAGVVIGPSLYPPVPDTAVVPTFYRTLGDGGYTMGMEGSYDIYTGDTPQGQLLHGTGMVASSGSFVVAALGVDGTTTIGGPYLDAVTIYACPDQKTADFAQYGNYGVVRKFDRETDDGPVSSYTVLGGIDDNFDDATDLYVPCVRGGIVIDKQISAAFAALVARVAALEAPAPP